MLAPATAEPSTSTQRRPLRSVSLPAGSRSSAAASPAIPTAAPTPQSSAPSSVRTNRGIASNIIPMARKYQTHASSSAANGCVNSRSDSGRAVTR